MELDRFSYLCGAMDAFAELVHAGVKQLALSHPCASLAERDALLPFAHGPVSYTHLDVYKRQVYHRGRGGHLCHPQPVHLRRPGFRAVTGGGKPQ